MSRANVLIKRAADLEWIPLVEEGVDTHGIFYKTLRYDEAAERSLTSLLKFEPGASYPNHNHPGGEELFALEGEIVVGDVTLKTGDYLYAPPGAHHKVSSVTGGVLLAVIPEEVELIGE